jgi:predicted metal-dependent phosphoesterase TrpH
MYKVDLHTHSIASPDGGLKLSDYRRMLARGKLDAVAITDHSTISFAQVAQAKLGEKVIIVGEEITTQQGEIIGLYLEEAVPAGLTLEEAIAAVRAQNGLVYVPHPFETVRQGIQKEDLDKIAQAVDIVEIYNGRAVFQNRSKSAAAWTEEHKKVGAASSDAHGTIGWGRTCSRLEKAPTRETLVALLASAKYRTQSVRFGVLHPKMNRLKRKLGSHA